MADQTAIQWANATFNPWIGCEKVSPGCAHCYAETLVTGRMARPGTWGADGVRQRTSESNWKKPLRWAMLARDGRLPNGEPNLDGHRPRIFCASLADVFEERAELDPLRDELFALILATPELDWLVLTKRPEHAREWFSSAVSSFDTPTRVWSLAAHLVGATRERGGWPSETWPLPNLWLGVSIENARHTYRADILREIPAAVRFISAEPLLGSLFPPRCDSPCFPMSMSGGSYICGRERDHGGLHRSEYDDGAEWNEDHVWIARDTVGAYAKPLDLSGIDWIIVGGESGPGARPFHLEHAREIIDAASCNVCGIGGCGECLASPAVFVKQLGAQPVQQLFLKPSPPARLVLRDRKGGDWSEWPADLRVREFPTAKESVAA